MNKKFNAMRVPKNQKILGPFLTYAEIHALERAISGCQMLDSQEIEILLRFILRN
jgi:hypothetical protein